ncbi:MAG TPA: glycosyltransferase family 39 protein [Terracidiphilus sp.]|nr:glycosyltransferase family 39 protein [Terracidiphilus sp.]
MLTRSYKRWAYAAWLLPIAAFAVLHLLHLQADFPNHSPWHSDWAKYTDEGWYGNAAIRAHLFGHWYLAGDFNPAPAVPVWPALEWVLFSFTGVSIAAARALAVSFFFADLLLGYLLLRARGSRWMALLAVTLAVTSPFLYCFSRLAILEPMLVALLLAALNLGVRLERFRRPVAVSAAIGVLFTLMLLTKTTAVFLLPALGWAMLAPLRADWRKAMRCAAAALAAWAITFGAWMALVVHTGLLHDYTYLFFVNTYPKPHEFYWPLVSLWWSFHGGLWVDRLLLPLAGLAMLPIALACRSTWSRRLWADPVFGASLLSVAGYILFMTYQFHPQPRYYTVVALFAFFLLAMEAEALVNATPAGKWKEGSKAWMPAAGAVVLGACALAAAFNGAWTLEYAAHPEYTFVNAARGLTRYIDAHPNGNRLLVSISGDEISMITHLPALCDDFGTLDLPTKLANYQPGWWAAWNDIDPGTLEDLHIHYSLQQVATFRAFDEPDRNVLVLFKLHPLPGGEEREAGPELQKPLPGDQIGIPVE